MKYSNHERLGYERLVYVKNEVSVFGMSKYKILAVCEHLLRKFHTNIDGIRIIEINIEIYPFFIANIACLVVLCQNAIVS